MLGAYRAGHLPLVVGSGDLVVVARSARDLRPRQSGARTAASARSVRRAGWRFTVDRDFARRHARLRRAGGGSAGRPGSPTTSCASYGELHRRGLAHSVEVWEGDELVGGLYGVTLGGFFGGESMFHRRTDASKAAVGYLIERLRAGGFSLLDAQVPTPHLDAAGRDHHPARRLPGAPARAR